MRNDAPNIGSEESDDVTGFVPDFEPDAPNETVTTFAPGDKVRLRKEYLLACLAIDGKEIMPVVSEIVSDATSNIMTVTETYYQDPMARLVEITQTAAQSSAMRRMLRLCPELCNVEGGTFELVKVAIKTSYGSKEVEFYADDLEQAPE